MNDETQRSEPRIGSPTGIVAETISKPEPLVSPDFSSEAERAIGQDRPDADFILAPLDHADALPQQAGALARVLRRPEVRRLMEEYRQFDATAERERRQFHAKRFMFRALAGVTAGAGVLSVCLQIALDYVSDLQLLLVAIHLIGLALLILMAWRIDRIEPRRRWKAARGEAEWRRIWLFTQVTDAEEPHDPGKGELPLAPLQLAYFRRYQLATQIRYFEKRPEMIERAVGVARGLTWIAALAGIVAFLVAALALGNLLVESGAAIPLSAVGWIARDIPGAAPWALAIVFVSSAFAVLLMQSEASEASRDSARYRALGRNLRFLLESGYEPVRQAVEAGDRDSLRRFVELVHGRLTAEVEEWLSSGMRMLDRGKGGAGPSASVEADLDRLLER